ncbi:MAG: ribonuclease R, partial [Marinirhabdus sp.]
MPSHKKRKPKAQKHQTCSESIINLLRNTPSRPYNHKQISAKLGLNDPSAQNQTLKTLKKMHAKGTLKQVGHGKYMLDQNINCHTGIMDLNARGNGYVIVEGMEHDIIVKNKNLNKALNGDVVEVQIIKQKKDGKNEGQVTTIVQRKRTEFVGTIQVSEKFAFVECTGHNMYTDIFVPKSKTKNAQNGAVVLVRIDGWENHSESPVGSVLKILGRPGEHNTEIHAILAQYGLPYEFPPEVETFAEQLDKKIQKTEIANRRDMRQTLTFTIDPKDAKDFDDALSFQPLENGNLQIGIHIADVSHYLKPGTVLDNEAYERATSVYLVDRVVPMLPEVLSNNICSLRPNEEKYTFSAVFEMNKKAEVVHTWFGRTVINSDARFAYEEAQHIIGQHSSTGTAGEASKRTVPKEISLTGKAYTVTKPITEAILEMDRLAKIIRSKRMRAGAISFDKIEVKFKLDENNEPEDVYFKESKDANKLIEEFMLLANRSVAEFIGKQTPKKTFVYRVHDQPNDEKIAQLEKIVSRFGHKLDTRNRSTTAKSMNKLLRDVVGKKEQNLVDTLAIRTMSKAQYTTENIGHYGLAFDHYTHFTSPIRRYPDVMVHRLLQHYLNGKTPAMGAPHEERCRHSTDMEILATNAERDSIKYMQVKYMQDHKNQEFLGVISGVTEWGVYVEIIENKCEGMVRLQDLRDDHYMFQKDEYAVVGQRTKNKFTLGDEVYIKVKQANLAKK